MHTDMLHAYYILKKQYTSMLFSMFMVGVWKTQLEDIQNHTVLLL